MDKTITISIKNVYGALKAYPECDSAKLFANIAGSKTLTKATLNSIAMLGYEIKTLSGHNGHWTTID